jgi:sulfate transport system permease protein
MRFPFKRHSVLPGFGLSFGFTLVYLGLVVLIPLSSLVVTSTALGWDKFSSTVANPRALAAYRLSFGTAALAATLNTLFGFVVAWVLVRYRFPGRRLLDALVDLPFALPTAVSGIALTWLYSPHGWLGRWLALLGIKVAYTWLGVLVALTFVGLPFVVRVLQPAIEDLGAESEEAAACLGAGRWQTFARVILPALTPVMVSGFAMAFARGLGEYGSVVFLSGNLSIRSEIAPALMDAKLEQYNHAGATAIALVMLVASLVILLAINLLQRWTRRWGLDGG